VAESILGIFNLGRKWYEFDFEFLLFLGLHKQLSMQHAVKILEIFSYFMETADYQWYGKTFVEGYI